MDHSTFKTKAFHLLLIISLFLLALLQPVHLVHSQQPSSVEATMVLRADKPGSVINRNIYGQFAEHLGRDIYGGLWVGEDSKVPNTRGIRNDVIAALKKLNLPVVRWPGGCFADEYHWRDGIGPRNRRPQRLNTWWGGVIETNAFGTHEFMDFCDLIGADAYIAGNVGSGSPQELLEWVEYMTSDSNSTLANLRRQNGRNQPWKVDYIAVGNENWGCGGSMRAEYYTDLFRRYSTFIKNYSGNHVQKIASGGLPEDMPWTEALLSQANRQMQGYSLHYYTVPSGGWDKKGSATEFNEAEWHKTMVQALRIDDLINKHSAIMDKYDPQKKIGLIVDEWGNWYDSAPGRDMGALYQQNTLRDAITAALTLNVFHQHADRVQMANIAQLINVLQAMILTDQEKMLVTPTYHVFEMYKVHQGATLLPIDISTPDYAMNGSTVPSLQASASRDKDGRIHVSIVNLDPLRSATAALRIAGARLGNVSGRVLTAPEMNSMNTFEHPDTVSPSAFRDFKTKSDLLTLTLPSKSVVVLEISP